jgi:CRISPR-associated protein Csb2
MTTSLVISVRLHDGRYHGADDWPPSPARLFQALIAGVARGESVADSDRAALDWLERLSEPNIAAPRVRDARGFINFVPNNALDAMGGDINRIGEIRTTKNIKPRLFDAEIPFLYVWRLDARDEDMRLARVVCAMAESLYQFGRGVDMAWAWGEVLEEGEVEARLVIHGGTRYRPVPGGTGAPLDCPMRGSFLSLENRFRAQAHRFSVKVEDGKVLVTFTQAPKPRFKTIAYNSPPALRLFDVRASAPDAPFVPWPQESASALALLLRDAAVERLRDALPTKIAQIERVLICRDATDADKATRVRILPLPSIGYHHVDPSIRRVLVEVPSNCPIGADDIAWAFSGLVIEAGEVDPETGEITGETRLVLAGERAMLTHYGIETDERHRQWWTVTPAALPETAARRRIEPRRLREEAKDGREGARKQNIAATAVLQALRHAGINARVSTIRVQREAFNAKGARAEAFAAGTRFAKHRLWHVEIVFAEPLSGPLLLGDGRYLGLGLMAPVQRVEGVHSFAILEGLADRADPMVLAQALRRAVMSRVQERIGKHSELPSFFSGHEPNGAPLRGGIHAHLAFAADVVRQRLLIVAPHVLERRQPTWPERQHLEALDASVADLSDLRAGAAGRLKLVWSPIHAYGDPLFDAGRHWESVTDYRPTRFGKRMSSTEAIVVDVRSELLGRGMPQPTHIEVTELREGPRGGLASKCQLSFAAAVSGPILIGRTCHVGGGLFSAAK